MTLCFPHETHPGESRVAATPATVTKLVKLGAIVAVEAGAGRAAGFRDEAYAAAGARVVEDRAELFRLADAVLRVRPS
jgi:NAD(P) transhydrogenase subunit alpha